jgi:16S rRNA C1402 N4-methylase RsmH
MSAHFLDLSPLRRVEGSWLKVGHLPVLREDLGSIQNQKQMTCFPDGARGGGSYSRYLFDARYLTCLITDLPRNP